MVEGMPSSKGLAQTRNQTWFNVWVIEDIGLAEDIVLEPSSKIDPDLKQHSLGYLGHEMTIEGPSSSPNYCVSNRTNKWDSTIPSHHEP